MMIAIGQASGSGDVKNEMQKAITNATIINTVLVAIMGFIAFLYIDVNQDAQRPYIILMLHIALLLSVISVSIASLQQISSS